MQAYGAPDRIDQLLGVVSDAIFEDHLYIFDIVDLLARNSLDDHDVGLLAPCERSYSLVFPEKSYSILGRDMDSFEGSEPCFD